MQPGRIATATDSHTDRHTVAVPFIKTVDILTGLDSCVVINPLRLKMSPERLSHERT